jgi:tRNA modification GTPase
VLYFLNQDTICAPATADGPGAIALIRISGPDALRITGILMQKPKMETQAGYTIVFGKIFHPITGEFIDEVLVSVFRAPKSYTGEEVTEISCHGSRHIQHKVLEALTEAGCRLALPGEFTFRAFTNGKLDLSQAEAVSDLIAGENDLARKTALAQMRGGYSKMLSDLRQELIDFAALIELELDFSEEDVAFADRDKLKVLITQIDGSVTNLAGSFGLGNVLRNGIPTAIIGKPNAGKSTLLNALLREEKAIVSPIPGTTRDVVEDVLRIGGYEFRLMDTAGLRQSEDIIEQEGISRSRERAQGAKLVIYIFDASETVAEIEREIEALELRPETYIIKIANKTDLYRPEITMADVLYISAKSGIGIEALLETMTSIFENDPFAGQEYIVTNARHYEALRRTSQSLRAALQGLEAGISGELVAFELRSAIRHLGEITGQIYTDDLLDSIFTRFCIGK